LKTASTLALIGAFGALSGLAQANEPAPKKDRTEVTSSKLVVPAGLSDRTKAQNAKGAETRDWSQVDANKDNLVSPEEMEAYLKANPGPLKPR
jgi:hypothetical protein